jgi:cytochrome c553
VTRQILAGLQGGAIVGKVRKVPTLVGISILLTIPAGLRAQDSASAAVAVCLPCHGPAVDTAPPAPGAPPFPKLDGQHPEYLVKQLREFKAGKRKNDLMVPILAKLSSKQFPALAAHFASQPLAPRRVENAQLAERGRVIYEEGTLAAGVPACVGCHLSNAVGASRYPRLAGQRQAYVVQQLTNFKSAARTNDRAHVMRSIAANLSDEDMRAVAEYVASR